MSNIINTIIQKDPTTFVIQKDPEVNYNRSQAVTAKEEALIAKQDVEQIKQDIDNILTNLENSISVTDNIEIGTETKKSTSTLVKNSTSDDTITPLYLDGINQKISTDNNTIYLINADIVGISDDGTKKGSYNLKATFHKGSDNISSTILGSPEIKVQYEDISDWDVNIISNTNHGTFEITVKGEISTSINWIAFIQYTQTSI